MDTDAKLIEAASHMAAGFIALMQHAREMETSEIEELLPMLTKQCAASLRPFFGLLAQEREACAQIADARMRQCLDREDAAEAVAMVAVKIRARNMDAELRWVNCEACGGSGEIIRGATPPEEYAELCGACEGTGRDCVTVLPVECNDGDEQ